jgi:hypothetical protein
VVFLIGATLQVRRIRGEKSPDHRTIGDGVNAAPRGGRRLR